MVSIQKKWYLYEKNAIPNRFVSPYKKCVTEKKTLLIGSSNGFIVNTL